MKRQDFVSTTAVKPIIVSSSAAAATTTAAVASTAGVDCLPVGSVVCVVPPARRCSPGPLAAAGASAVHLSSGPASSRPALGPAVAAGSVNLQPLRHIGPPSAVAASSGAGAATAAGGGPVSLQRNLLPGTLAREAATATPTPPPPPPHLLTALAQAAAGPHVAPFRRGAPTAAHAGSQSLAPLPVGPAVCGENLSVRRDSCSPFQDANQQQQQHYISTVSSGSQSSSSTVGHSHFHRRTHAVLTPVLSTVVSAATPHCAPSVGGTPASTPVVKSSSGSIITSASPSASTVPSNNNTTTSGGGGSEQSAAAAVSAALSDTPAQLGAGSAAAGANSGAPGTATAASSVQPGYHRLRVEDALSYLDQVKSKFHNCPEVYNDFLDIMKEFKAQNIDTPGVITRVSSLFRGHPALIVGFNTFLPPGYKIEVQSGSDFLHVSMTAPGQVTTVVHTPIGGLHTYHDQTDSARSSHPHPLPQSSHHHHHHPHPHPQQQQEAAAGSPPSVCAGGAAVKLAGTAAAGQVSATPVAAGAATAAAVAHTAQIQFRNSYGTNNIVSGHMGGRGGSGGAAAAATAAAAAAVPINVVTHHSYTQQQQQPPSLPQQQQLLPSLSGHPVASAGTPAVQGVAAAPSGCSGSGSQPVEFKHAINYVNKIKSRFQGQPEVYKQFLEILHTYQKEQRSVKEAAGGGAGGGAVVPTLSESEVYAKVAALFHKHEDLMGEFGQFLPDASNDSAFSAFGSSRSLAHDGRPSSDAAAGSGAAVGVGGPSTPVAPPLSGQGPPAAPSGSVKPLASVGGAAASSCSSSSSCSAAGSHHSPPPAGAAGGGVVKSTKRALPGAAPPPAALHHQLQQQRSSATATGGGVVVGAPPPAKRPRVGTLKDVSLAEAAKFGTLNDFAFFDQVRKVLRSQDVYNNFLRVLSLYNAEVISRYDVIQLVTPFIGRKPGLLKWLKDFMGVRDSRVDGGATPVGGASLAQIGGATNCGGDSGAEKSAQRAANVSDLTVEIDPSTCKRLGASYCALPSTYQQPSCSGRTQLCRDVLNDVWVSFPSYSEDSTFVTSRKTQYEEYIYRCEDERFELDMVLETNLATIRLLEGVQKRLQRLTADEGARYRLDDCLGGTSPTIHQRAVRRIYGDKAGDIIDGLKKNPLVAVPVVLRRLKAKQEEWREAQKGYNKVWREQNEKYYLKSLDPLGINFKQSDIKQLRSKQLLHELYQLFDERSEQLSSSTPTAAAAAAGMTESGVAGGEGGAGQQPHMQLVYRGRHVIDDACQLIVHHVKRLSGLHKDDKSKMKRLVRHTLATLLHQPVRPADSDGEDDQDDQEQHLQQQQQQQRERARRGGGQKAGGGGESEVTASSPASATAPAADRLCHVDEQDGAEHYTLFMASSHWYLFLRLHQILCDRLWCVHERALALCAEERHYRRLRSESVAVALRLKPSNEIEVEDYYPAFLDMLKSVLDNSMDSNQYEDTLREMFGAQAYHAFTADKIVSSAVRQLQYIVTDSAAQLTLSEYLAALGRGGTGGACSSAHLRQSAEHAYVKRVEQLLTEENEHCMKIYIFKQDGRMTIELLDTTDSEDSDDANNDTTTTNNNNNNTAGANSNNNNGSSNGTSSQSASGSADRSAGTANSSFVDEQRRTAYQEAFVDAVAASAADLQFSDSKNTNGSAMFLARNVRRSAARIGTGAGASLRRHPDPGAATGTDSLSEPGTVCVKTEPISEGDSEKDAATKIGGSGSSGSTQRNSDADEQQDVKPSCLPSVSAATPAAGALYCEGGEQVRVGSDYRLRRVAKTGALLARQHALQRAKQCHRAVSERMYGRFSRWHNNWCVRHVSSGQRQHCDDWLMGRHPPHPQQQGAGGGDDREVEWLTACCRQTDTTRPPYRAYNRYRVKQKQQQQ